MRTVLTRNSAAWAFDATGSLVEHAPNVLRREYNPVSGALLGALIEEQRTNICAYSNDFAEWDDRLDAVITANDGVDAGFNVSRPPGGNTSSGAVYRASFVQGDYYALTIDVQADTTDQFGLTARRFYNSWFAYFDASAGVFTDVDTLYTSTSVQAMPGGWYRVGLIFRYADDIHSNVVQFGDALAVGPYHPQVDGAASINVRRAQITRGRTQTSYIPTNGSEITRSPDKLDAPAGNWLPAGRHTWLGAVRMSRDPQQPTVLGHPDGRIYAESGRLHLDGPGELRQPESDFAAGDYVPFAWTVELPGAAPDFTIGRDAGDADYWNGHILDINPYPRVLRDSEITKWLAR